MTRPAFPHLLRLYALALRLYPPRFRARFGKDMLQLFQDRCRDEAGHGLAGRLRLFFSTAADVLTHAAAERRIEAMDRRNVAVIGGEPMGLLVQDMRHAMRGIARRRGFTAV